MCWWEKLDKKRGSRPRCVLLTDGSREEVASRLTGIVAHSEVSITPDDIWMPKGKPVCTNGTCGTGLANELELNKPNELVAAETSQILRDWWFAVSRGAKGPTWDIASKCKIYGKRGILLVEAKAHCNELCRDGKSLPQNGSADSWRNHRQIGNAISDAAAGLQFATGKPWAISRDMNYQLSNRFAWAWKLAMSGTPVVLLYLGFLNAQEMADQGEPITSADHWASVVQQYGSGTIDSAVWGSQVDIDGVPLIPLLRTYEQPFLGGCSGIAKAVALV